MPASAADLASACRESCSLRSVSTLRDADDRAVHGVVELIAAQDDVERLIPRHFVEDDVDRALHVRIDHHVETADLGEAAQHRAEVGALEVEAHRVTREALLPSGGLLQRGHRGCRRRSEHDRRRARFTACRRRLGRWRGRPSRRGRLGGRSRGARRLHRRSDGACAVERRHRVRGRSVRRDRRRVPDRLLHGDGRLRRFLGAGAPASGGASITRSVAAVGGSNTTSMSRPAGPLRST